MISMTSVYVIEEVFGDMSPSRVVGIASDFPKSVEMVNFLEEQEKESCHPHAYRCSPVQIDNLSWFSFATRKVEEHNF